MTSVTFNNYYSFKILIVSVFSIYLLKTKYQKIQWMGKCLISLGILSQFLSDKSSKVSVSAVTALSAALFNAFSTVFFEYKVKKTLSSMWNYLFTFNMCYLPFNLVSAIIESKLYDNMFALLKLPFYLLTILNVFSMQMSVHLSMRVDSFERTIISVVCSMLSSLISDKLLDLELKVDSLISFCFVFTGTLLYVCSEKETSEKENK